MTPVPGTILIARPLWPVLRRLGDLLSRRGCTVETAATWGGLLDGPRRGEGLGAVLLGEYGAVAEEEEILRQFRDAGRPGVPVFLVGGQSAVRRTRRFREAGADLPIVYPVAAGEDPGSVSETLRALAPGVNSRS